MLIVLCCMLNSGVRSFFNSKCKESMKEIEEFELTVL